jgi:hypothetical protein
MTIKSFWDEEWIDLKFDNLAEKSKYKISNYGRIMSYFFNEKGVLLKCGATSRYKIFNISDKSGNKIQKTVHRLVASLFLDKPNEDQTQVIHLDNNKHNNYYKNLKWANEKEKRAHQDVSVPGWQLRGKVGFRATSKLTESQVKLIKRKINDPHRKTRMKIIAKRYGVSVMQLYRIKSGENWSSVNPD